jgi:hypothetical protein
MIRKTLAALAIALMAVIGLNASPAFADGAAPGHLTGFDGGLFSTAIVDVNPAFWDHGDCIEIDSSLDNRVSAWVNSSNATDFIAYVTDGCAPGTTQTLYHNTQGTLSGTMNNNIESFRRSWSN